MTRRLIAIVSIVFLGSCTHVAKLPEGFAVDPKSPNGVVITSLTFEGGLRLESFTLEYRLVGGGDTERMHNASMLSAPDIESDGRRGWLFPRELPPGEYEFYKWRGTAGNMTYWSPTEFSHQFTVSAGRATYIGSLNVLTSVTKRYQVQVRDERDRDLQAFAARYPRIQREQIAFDIMSTDQKRPVRRQMKVDDFKDILPEAAERRKQDEERRRMDSLRDLLPGTAK